MKILFTGGGTMGSVSPLIAVANTIKEKEQSIEFLWLGTKSGPEKEVVENYGFKFKPIIYGKWPRYFSYKNFLAPVKVLAGFIQAILIIKKFKPDIILSAGAFVSVPVIWAGWLLKKKSLIHQQDIRPGLANKLMTSFANGITVTFEESLKYFPKDKTVLTSNPIRQEIFQVDKEKAREKFNLEPGLPTVLFLGGGTGALRLNEIISQAIPKLVKFCQIIHVTGKGKKVKEIKEDRYHDYEFLIDDMRDAYTVADLILSRAGLSTLTEISVLTKPTVLIPLPGHQEDNASYYAKNNAALFLSQKGLTAEKLVKTIKNLLDNPSELENLQRNIGKMIDKDAAEKIVREIYKILSE